MSTLKKTRRVSAFICMLTLAVLSLSPLAHAADTTTNRPQPRRVVSMNLCTDQLTLLLADPSQIRSVSYVAHDPATSVMSRQARRYPPNHGHAEEIFLMQPDLILAGGFTRRATTELLRRLGFRVEIFYPAQSFTDIRANIARLGQLLARPVKTAEMLKRFDSALAKAEQTKIASAKSAALYYANNYTSGSGTLAADIVARAGLNNIGTSLGLDGMVKLPLELLVVRAPDVIIAEQRDPGATALAYETFTHPALTATAARASAFIRTDSTWSCGAPFTIDAIYRLTDALRDRPVKQDNTTSPTASGSAPGRPQ